MKDPYKIIFLNQRSGTLFQELARDISRHWHPSAIWTQVIGTFESDQYLTFTPAPGYNRKNYLARVFSWSAYFICVWFKLLFHSSKSILFIVTMPPFLGLCGYLLKILRKQKYVILVYDIHPDLLIKFGGLKNRWIIKSWRKMNSVVLSHADAVMTIGEYMARNLERQFDVKKTTLGEIAVVHGWADVDWIKPLAKNENPFIRQHHLEDKLIVMYSGNIGATHDIETLVEVIKRFKDNSEIIFVIIGDGAKKQYVVDCQNTFNLNNLLILPYVPQEQLPLSLSAADISVVSMEEDSEGFLVPSRIYSCLSAGNALIAACGSRCELADIVQNNQCGTIIRPKDPDALVAAICIYHQDRNLLDQTKNNSRSAAIAKYSRKNSKHYIDLFEKLFQTQLSANA